ncbi:hypothetical protein MMC07_000524 [Pseudocyphellaria aurata]|nr:hypothetical protein [Pseudocyphellaria aurata]
MSEENPQASIQARIAALNLSHLGRAPTRTATVIEEDTSERPKFDQRSNSINVAPTLGLHSISRDGIGNEPSGSKRNGVLPPPTIVRTGQAVPRPPRPTPPPRLPPRTPSSQPSPSLPPRRPSGNLARRDSTESIASTISNISSISGLSSGTARTSTSRTPSVSGDRMMPPVYDPSSLPFQPPKHPTREADKKRMPLKGAKSTPSVTTLEVSPLPPTPTPSLPPRRPARQSSGPARRLPPEQPPAMPAKSALSYGMNDPERDSTNGVDTKVSNPPVSSASAGTPPPVPIGTRPDLSKLQASKPKPQAIAPTSCMLCRDFSGPDTHAARFPRESVPSLDWLATQLVAPFSSLTDRARAIFTWLHHNISYDVDAFFNNAVQPSTPASTLSTGLAVCEGYAGLFTALATTAGLESVVIGGHGKGFGFSTMAPGTPIPPETSNHAWNVVKIDNGEWKLIDCCWGAGNIKGPGQPYNKDFTPSHFTMSNNDFGLRHFPTNNSQFFRTDGRRLTWEDYITGDRGPEKVHIYNMTASEGLSDTKFLPQHLKIPVAPSKHNGPTVRFQFERVCEHWDPIRHGPGKPYIYILGIHGVDGRADDYVPFETNGFCWWADVPPQKLGAPGQKITIFTVATIGGGSGRGLSLDEYRLSKGRKAWSGDGVAAWELI